jgi:hypothetical protein
MWRGSVEADGLNFSSKVERSELRDPRLDGPFLSVRADSRLALGL